MFKLRPAIEKRIVCLANSRKTRGRCFAGKEVLRDGSVGGWIRPVSNRETEEVSWREYHYEDGTDPLLLDIIETPLVEAKPKIFQQENWLIDDKQSWKKLGEISWDNLQQFADAPDSLGINGYSTKIGSNDRIPESLAGTLVDSLFLIEVSDLVLVASDFYNRPRVLGCFWYNGTEYRMWMTAHPHEREYINKPNDAYRIGKCFLTISLGSPHTDGFAYKFIASVIEPE